MALVNDVHHIAFLTADMDRLISFYARIFDARVTLDVEDPVRHAFIEIGGRPGPPRQRMPRRSLRQAIRPRFTSVLACLTASPRPYFCRGPRLKPARTPRCADPATSLDR